ncbi:MAG: hypothetical protein ACLUD0_08460 [Eubacterium ramulus]
MSGLAKQMEYGWFKVTNGKVRRLIYTGLATETKHGWFKVAVTEK